MMLLLTLREDVLSLSYFHFELAQKNKDMRDV